MSGWPKEIVKGLGREPKVGDWFAPCCIEDLTQITSDEQLAELLEDQAEEDAVLYSFWASRESAEKDLLT